MYRRFESVLLPLLLLPIVGRAQAPDLLVPGRHIRVIARCQLGRDQVTRCSDDGKVWTYTGQLEAIEDDSLHIRMPSQGAEVVVPRSRATYLWVADGKQYNGWNGAGIGAALGGFVGLALGIRARQNDDGEFAGSDEPFGFAVGALAGALVGRVIGGEVLSERWRSISVGEHRISVLPRVDMRGFMVSVKF